MFSVVGLVSMCIKEDVTQDWRYTSNACSIYRIDTRRKKDTQRSPKAE